MPIPSTELESVIFVLQPSHSSIVLIWQIFNSYSLSEVNFLGEQSYTLLLQGWFLEQLISSKNCSFGVFSLVLNFFRGTVIFSNSNCQEDQFEGLIFCKGNRVMFFQNTTWSCPFFSVSFYLKRGKVWSAIHSFKRTGFFWMISLSHPFFHVRGFIITKQLQPSIASWVTWSREFLASTSY